MVTMRSFQAKLRLLSICLTCIYTLDLLASSDDTGAIYYRQHTQDHYEFIENDELACDEDYDDDEDFVQENTKQEQSDYGLMTLSYHSPKGIGYNRSYFSLGFSHAAKAGKTGFFSAADWRFHVLSSGRFAMNLGAGARYIDNLLTQALGAFAYYDFRTTHLKNYHQAGVALEWFNTYFDIRFNGYYPFGDSRSRTWHHIRKKSDPHPLIHSIYNYSYARLEAEIGTSFDITRIIDFYVGVQGYYLKSKENIHNAREAFGTRLRLVTTGQDRPSLELLGSYDPIFKTRLQFACSVPLSYETSLFSALKGTCCPKLLRKIGALPARDDLIVLKSKHYRNRK
jgi:hypothetical protein